MRVINTPMNMQGELVLDFRNCSSLTVTLYPKFRTVDVIDDITIANGDIIAQNGDLLLEDA